MATDNAEPQTEVDLEITTDAQQTEAKHNEDDNESQATTTDKDEQHGNSHSELKPEQRKASKHQVQESMLVEGQVIPKSFSVANKEANVQEAIHQETRKPCCDNPICNKDVHIRLARWTFITALPVIFLFVLTHRDEIDLAFLIGIAIEAMYVVYFSMIAYLFYSGTGEEKHDGPRYLFRIWTRSESVRGWADMSIAAEQRRYALHAIQSISEFSAVEGAISSSMLANLGSFSWATVAMHFAAELSCNSLVFGWDIADYCEIIGVCGLVMIGMFELNPYNPGMKLFHYIGAAAGVGTIAGYVIQSWSRSHEQGWQTLIAPVIIAVIGGTCFILWQWSNKQTDAKILEFHKKYTNATVTEKPGNFLCIPCKQCKRESLDEQDGKVWEICKPITDKDRKEIRRAITRLSIRNVVTEGIFLFSGATSLALWLMFYHEDCEIGCAGRQVASTPAPNCL